MNSIHLILISAQAVPNITPILDERFRPQQVIMLVSPDMEKRADCLEQIYRPRGVSVIRWPIADAWDIEHIRERVMALLSEYEQYDILLNATGGTKPMSIAAYEVFRAFDKPIFYVHPEQDRLIWMHPDNRPSVELADRIKLKAFLQAYGVDRVDETHQGGVPQNLRDLSSELIAHIEVFAKSLGRLNYFAALADNPQLRTPDLGQELNGDHAFWKIVDLFEHAGLLHRAGKQLAFVDENARFIANGGWLELHAYACCLNLKKSHGLQDVGRGIEVTRRHGKNSVKNEMDVAFLKDNRLYLLECKTKRIKGDGADYDEGAEILYKLDSLRDLLGGLQAKAMLVSFNPLKPQHRNRARELKIECCCHQELQSLESKIAEWLNF